MRRNKPILLLLSLITVVTVAFSGCANVESTNKNSASTDASNTTAAAGKIPITTSSGFTFLSSKASAPAASSSSAPSTLRCNAVAPPAIMPCTR